MRETKTQNKGFTILETIAALTIFIMAMALALSGFMFLLKNTNQESAQAQLDMNVQQTMERIKHDIRLSSLDEVFYYEDPNGSFQALSFPLGQDLDDNGVLDKDIDGKIIWGAQIIYHIKLTTPNELIKTTFSPRDPLLTDSERQVQLEDVVASGGSGAGNATSKTLFKNMLKWEILPIAGRYDAYSDSAEIREEGSLGYALISPGTHQFTFKSIGQSGSGLKIGIDQLYVSPSYGAREAERQIITTSSGATAAPQYMPWGSWKGRHQLLFPASAVGDSFTLSMDNDRWEESNFSTGSQVEDAEIVWTNTLAEYVVKLAGNETTWSAPEQMGGTGSDSNFLQNTTVQTLVKGSQFFNNGNRIQYNGNKCKLVFKAPAANPFHINDIFIAESHLSNLNATTVSNFTSISGPKKLVANSWAIPAGTTATNSNWLNFPIDKEKNYLVEFEVFSLGQIRKWEDVNTSHTSPDPFLTSRLTTATSTNFVDYAVGLEAILSSYPTNGTYTSRIFDTHLDAPQYGDLTKTSNEPTGTSISIEVRTGNQWDLSDAASWSGAGSSGNSFAIPAANKRYIQFQATLSADTPATETPLLRDVTIEWTGEERLVNIGGVFTKGSDYGIFEVEVDGHPLRAALVIELEIYKEDVRGMDGKNRTISSALKVDMTPRNSGL